MPPVLHSHFASTPVEVSSAIPLPVTNGGRVITEWTLTVPSVTYAGKRYRTPFQAVVDSGNWLNIVPPDLADL